MINFIYGPCLCNVFVLRLFSSGCILNLNLRLFSYLGFCCLLARLKILQTRVHQFPHCNDCPRTTRRRGACRKMKSHTGAAALRRQWITETQCSSNYLSLLCYLHFLSRWICYKSWLISLGECSYYHRADNLLVHPVCVNAAAAAAWRISGACYVRCMPELVEFILLSYLYRNCTGKFNYTNESRAFCMKIISCGE